MSEKVVPKQKALAFTKEQILSSARFASRHDLLSVLLEDGKSYTFAEVNAAIEKFMKGGKK